MSGYLTMAVGGREMAAPLDQVREVVRAVGIEALPGSRAPITGLVQLRGEPLPVVDLRTAPYPGGTGDLVVLVGRPGSGESGALALAVDRVLAVVTATEYELVRRRGAAGAPGVRHRAAAADRVSRAAADGLRGRPVGPGGCGGLSRGSAHGLSLDVALEDAGLGQPGQPLADGAGPALADALDGLQVVDARGQQPLQAAEVLDEPVDDGPGSRGTLASSR